MQTPQIFARKEEQHERALMLSDGVAKALQYTVPKYRKNKSGKYIEFYAFDPALGDLRRKRIKMNRVYIVKGGREYINDVLKRLLDQLKHGWNPWINKDIENLDIFSEVLDRYEAHVEKMYSGGYYRKETYAGYKSYIKILREYTDRLNPIYYVYQLDRRYCVAFLDYIFIDRDNGAQTRNNYLNFLSTFSGYLVEKGYLKSRPTDGIAPISKRLYAKERTVIPVDVVGKISEYCNKHDPHFLLVCHILYYCFIRPVEITRLKIGYIDIQGCKITIPASASKNHKTQSVTIPKKVLLYAIELGIFSAASSDYLFSIGLKPGPEPIDTKIFRDHWAKVRKALKLRKEWKLYSLKDTGITEMLRDNMAAIDVRDQARHSSLAITELYTDHTDRTNPAIMDLDGAL